MDCLVERVMPFDIALAGRRNITKENDLLRLQPPEHFIVSVHKQSTCGRAFLGAYGGYCNASADRFAVKAPLEAIMIAPADGRNDRNAHALPVSADQMLAVVVVDLHGSGIIGKQAEVRRHSRLEFRKKERIASGVMPCALKNVIVHKEVNTVDAALSVCSGTVAGLLNSMFSTNEYYRAYIRTFNQMLNKIVKY